MLNRKTSRDAYNIIKENGLLSQRRFEVYDALYQFGPLTVNECFAKMYSNNLGPKNAASNSAARFSELRDAGVIEEVRTRICSITGMNVIEWEVTDRLPMKFEKPKKIKCAHCRGTGVILEQQAKLF